MLEIRLTSQAEQDIDQITGYTIDKWGWRQTATYLSQLEDGFELIATNPGIGRACDEIHSGLRRFEIGQHVAFFLVQEHVLLIVRVLHQHMLPSKHF